jgi:aminoglycoside phosphotransferase family enzyme/predicted kinase
VNPPPTVLTALPPLDAVIETHISWVLLAGTLAWKVKKPVTLPFLDYHNLTQRRQCCAEEFRLNRRFAPQLYRAVVELGGEPAIEMQRFADTQRLDQVCARGALSAAHLNAFARQLAAWQASAPLTPEFGSAATIQTSALENFTELFALQPAAAPRLEQLHQWTTREFARRHADFTQRQHQGRIREGHGDLHLANLVLLNDVITPFDAIEFNAAFRCIDVASEIAFTLLDLLDHQQPGLATLLLSEWLVWSGDFDALRVLRFYLVYRALVRAKVAALQNKTAECASYLTLAERLTQPTQPTLIITHGPSGSGKTHASTRRLASADFLRTVRVRADVERKRLYGLAPDADSGGSIYSPAATLRTYTQLADLADLGLRAGWSVIVDAAFLKRAERDGFRQLASTRQAPFGILTPTADPTTCHARLLARQGDASEATPAVLAQQLTWAEPLTRDEQALQASS